MNVSGAVLRAHIDYTNWATNRLLAQAATLTGEQITRDFGTADKSVFGTLAHIFVSDRLWLSRLKQEEILNPGKRPSSWDALSAQWPPLQEQWTALAATWTDETTDELVVYRDMRGNQWVQPLWQLAMHIVNHATHHRGQVSGFLRAMGHTPDPLDLVAYYRQIGQWRS